MNFGNFGKFPLLGTTSREHPAQAALAEAAAAPAIEEDAHSAMPCSSLRLVLVDSAGCRRTKVVPAASAAHLHERGVGVPKACMALPVFSEQPAADSGITAVGQVYMEPVEDSAVVAAWAPVPTRLMTVQLTIAPGVSWECCPRSALARALKGFQEEYGLRLRVSFTSEFVLLRPLPGSTAQGPWAYAPVDSHAGQWCQSQAVDANAEVLEDIAQALAGMGVTVHEYWAGAAPGQFVFATGQFEALEAADMLVLTREAVQGVARKHGLVACFAPKYAAAAGNACHCHLSLFKDGKCVMAHPEQPHGAPSGQLPMLSTEASQMLAGLLVTLPAAMPFLASSFNSYARFAKGVVAWSWDNPETPVRVTCPPGTGSKGGPFNHLSVVVAALDASANPYIGLTALVASTMLGMLTNTPVPTPPLTVPVTGMRADDKVGFTPLPGSLTDAIAAYESENKEWLGAPFTHMLSNTLLGVPLTRAYMAVRKAEAANGPGAREHCLRY